MLDALNPKIAYNILAGTVQRATSTGPKKSFADLLDPWMSRIDAEVTDPSARAHAKGLVMQTLYGGLSQKPTKYQRFQDVGRKEFERWAPDYAKTVGIKYAGLEPIGNAYTREVMALEAGVREIPGLAPIEDAAKKKLEAARTQLKQEHENLMRVATQPGQAAQAPTTTAPAPAGEEDNALLQNQEKMLNQLIKAIGDVGYKPAGNVPTPAPAIPAQMTPAPATPNAPTQIQQPPQTTTQPAGVSMAPPGELPGDWLSAILQLGGPQTYGRIA